MDSFSSAADVRPDPDPITGLVPQDPGDDYRVAVAREAGVDYIVSGDQHLTELRSSRPPVITPADLVAALARRRA